MGKIRYSLAAVVIAAVAVVGVGSTLAVRAHEGEDQTSTNTTTNNTETEQNSNAAREKLKGRLADVKKKVCENRVDVIKKIMTNAAATGQRHLEVFSKIQTRVQEFYTNKKLTVANYDALVAAANAKKDAAVAAINAVKNNTNFSCDGDNPVGSIDAFNGKVKAMHQALKDYRTAIGSLLNAVKGVAEAKEGGKQS